AQGRVQKNRKLRTGAVRTDGLIEFQRIGDAITRKGVDHEPFAGLCGTWDTGIRPVLARGDHLLRRRFDGENALVDIDDGVDERDLGVQSRLGDDAHRLAEPHYQSLLGLINGEEGAVGDDQHNQQYYGDHAAG